MIMPKYIELNRVFWPVEADKGNDPESIRLMLALGINRQISWEHLLGKTRVVILAEPGTGKTEELREITKRLRIAGKPAFFCKIELLQSLGFRQTFDIGTGEEFDEWLTGDQEGYFFLDSVDEARLRDRLAFDVALRRFADAIGEHLNQAKVFVTCRVSEWRATADLSMFLRLLPKQQLMTINYRDTIPAKEHKSTFEEADSDNGSSDRKQKPDQIVFQLAPLNEWQIRHFAEEKGVYDVDSFMNVIDRAGAMVFAERPQDLLELISFWKLKGGLGRLSEMLEFNIGIKLAEHNPDRDLQRPVSVDDALLGAERLAAAITLQKKNEVILPDQPINTDLREAAIDPKDVLPDWSPDRIQTLLDRAIFDEAIYGTVRFHHRSVRDYLAAKWLKRLLDKGQPRRSIEGMLFAQRYGKDVVIPSMRPIIAWLAIWDERIRNRLLTIAPEVLIEYGDPSSLPVEFRKSLLVRFAELYAEHEYTGTSFDITMIRRLADPQLTSITNDLLKKFANHNDVCTLLLKMIWQGQMKGAVDAAFTFAIDDQANSYTRRCAIRAVAAAGTHDQRCRLVNALMKDITKLEARVLSEICEAFFPELLSVEQLLEILTTAKPSKQFSTSPMEQILDDIANSNIPDEVAEQLLPGLHKFLISSPFIERRHCRISKKYAWLLPGAIKLANRFIQKKHPLSFDPVVLDLFLGFLTIQDYHHYHPSSELEEILKDAKGWSKLGFQLFWHAIAAARTQDKDSKSRINNWWQVGWEIQNFWVPIFNDLDRLFDDLKHRDLIDDRLVALTAIFTVYIEEGRPRKLRDRMKRVVDGTLDLEIKLKELLHPKPLTDEQKKYRRQERTYKLRREAREKRQESNRQDWVKALKKAPEEIKNVGNASKGEIWTRTAYLYNRLREKKTKGENRYGYSNWKALIDEFGYEVAKNFRDGCVAFWRNYDPFIYPNRRTDDAIPWARIIGLMGLAMESADDPEWSKHISHHEAIIAAHYSVCELNGFPIWFSELYKEFPILIEEVIQDELRWELHKGPVEKKFAHTLLALRYGDVKYRNIFKRFLFELLSEREPVNDMVLNDTLSVILEGNPDAAFREKLANLACSRFQEASEQSRKLTWLSVLLCVDGVRGTKCLKGWINGIPSVEEQKETMINYCATLTHNGGNRFGRFVRDYERLDVLRGLLPFIFQYVKPEEDTRHEGIYTPAARDDAERTRSRLLGVLLDTPGRPSFDVLVNLSKVVNNGNSKDRIDCLAKERAALDAEFEPWSGAEVAEFTLSGDRKPQTQADLYELALVRLDELKDDIENGDESQAVLLQKATQETEIRTTFAYWLRKSSRGLYTVGSEEELADATRTDIRFHAPQVSASVPIELKIADKWSFASLRERLENQLVNQYMRVSQHGVFLVVHNGEKKYWKDVCSKKLTFAELVGILKQEANGFVKKYPNIVALEVVGIDFTARSFHRRVTT